MAGHSESPLSHVVDHPTLEFPHWAFPYAREIHLPKDPFFGIQITRFMVTELIASALVLLVMIPMARHVARHPVSKGKFFNAFEAILLYIRDKVARPAIGGHGADAYSPFLWTIF